jgi:ABC-type multidrug transport system ATPase subunit
MSGESTLRVVEVTKSLGGRRVLDRLSLAAAAGVTAVLGRNGSGKTTLLRIVAGVLEPDEGAVFVAGRPLERARHLVGYVPEAADPPAHLTVAELLALVAALRRAPPLEPSLREPLGVPAIADRRIASLSLGQRRRACLAAALVGAPALLVLDEPTNGLDPTGIETLATLLRAHAAAGRTALVATHDLDFAASVDARNLQLGIPSI